MCPTSKADAWRRSTTWPSTVSKKLIAGGMGLRPLMGFNQVGIEVYHGGDAPTVGHAIQAIIAGNLPQFSQEHTCGVGGGH
jgi:predicted Fe-Mo cluster-binding NifX family protein